MEKIDWNDRFSVGVKELDSQHQRLIDLMNRLIDIQDRKRPDDAIADALGSLTNYLGYHFETEEQLMLDHHYPDFEDHRDEHQAFVTQVACFIAVYRSSGNNLKRDILTFLQEWLTDHILGTDAVFGRFLKQERTRRPFPPP